MNYVVDLSSLELSVLYLPCILVKELQRIWSILLKLGDLLSYIRNPSQELPHQSHSLVHLAITNAENLAGITLTQIANPGSPVIYGSVATVMDLRTGNISFGSF